MSSLPVWIALCVIAFVAVCAMVLVILFLTGWLDDEKEQHDFGQGWAEWPPKSPARCSKCGGMYAMFANCGGLDECKGRK